MKRVVYFSLLNTLFFSLTGCANLEPQTASPKEVYKSATQVVNPKVMMPTQPNQQDFQLAYGNNPALAKAYAQYIKTGKAPNITTDGFQQFAYGASQPVIAASPIELTVISLEAGENITNVSSGDPLRWSYSMATSGQGKNKQAHVMVKPSQADISTDLVITTDKRMYTLKLVSGDNTKYVKDVRFWYPDEIQDYWNNYNQNQQPGNVSSVNISGATSLDLKKVNFDYSISAPFFSSPSWKPTRVFDDGTHTYIQFPDTLSNQELPALFIANGNNQELVNYRYKKPYFVVDKIFDKAVLLMGVGQNQSKITLTNNHYV
jgi:P-type conjugative transfer protein TrbG